jgi:hypothetical protein
VVVRFVSVAAKKEEGGDMKKHVLWLTVILMAVFSSAAVSTKAQTSYGVRANVPFDFTVGDKTLPAGRIAARGGTDSLILSISNLDKGPHEFRIARRLPGAGRSDRGKLIFRRHGNQYFLAQVWIRGNSGWEIFKSKSEKAIEREMRLARNSKPELVTVLAEIQ